jgi:ATP-dependent helicase HepA
MPQLSPDWWQKNVVERLSFSQQRTVQERRIHTLQQLDFAALLRVVDQNWYELSSALNLPREGRNWVKELQHVRNKWAHLSAEAIPPGELYRDAELSDASCWPWAHPQPRYRQLSPERMLL